MRALAAGRTATRAGDRSTAAVVHGTRAYADRRTQLAWVAMAFGALAAGALLYAVARPYAAAFLPAGWHRPALAGTLLPLAAALIGAAPTFVHAFAMSLLIAMATQAATSRGRGWCCAAVCAVEFAFEIAQHPAVTAVLLGSVMPSPVAGGIDGALRAYLMHGTFDPLDLHAACVGCLTAFTLLAGPARARLTSPGARHVAA